MIIIFSKWFQEPNFTSIRYNIKINKYLIAKNQLKLKKWFKIKLNLLIRKYVEKSKKNLINGKNI